MTDAAPPAPEAPASQVVKVNLDDAVKKLAVKDGVKDSAELTKVVGVRRYDQYAAQVRSYYAGFDEGHASGIAMMGRPLRRHVAVVMAVCACGGGLVGFAAAHLFLR